MSCCRLLQWSIVNQCCLLTPADVFLSLDAKYQAVIADICKRMGAGMADFAGEDEDSEVRQLYAFLYEEHLT